MKRTQQILPLIILGIYILVPVYFAIYNWPVISSLLPMDTGFGNAEMHPFIVLYVFGFVLVLALVLYQFRTMNRSLFKIAEQDSKIQLLKKDLEIEMFKSKLREEKMQVNPDGGAVSEPVKNRKIRKPTIKIANRKTNNNDDENNKNNFFSNNPDLNQ